MALPDDDKLPLEIRAVLARYAGIFHVPTGAPGEAFDERARQWCIRLAEQVSYEHGPQWGVKRADPGRPISKDSLAWTNGAVLLSWDLLTGVGTGQPVLVSNPSKIDITGQMFQPVVARDHLGTMMPPAPPETPAPLPPTQTVPLEDLLRLVATLEVSNERRYLDLAAKLAALPPAPRSFSGTFKLPFFGTVSIHLVADADA